MVGKVHDVAMTLMSTNAKWLLEILPESRVTPRRPANNRKSCDRNRSVLHFLLGF